MQEEASRLVSLFFIVCAHRYQAIASECSNLQSYASKWIPTATSQKYFSPLLDTNLWQLLDSSLEMDILTATVSNLLDEG